MYDCINEVALISLNVEALAKAQNVALENDLVLDQIHVYVDWLVYEIVRLNLQSDLHNHQGHVTLCIL